MLAAVGSFNTAKISQGFKQGITTDFQLQHLGDKITYYDEVLTMSARMAAATGDLSWKERYEAFEPKLIESIDRVIDLNTDAYSLQVEPITKVSTRLKTQIFDAFFTTKPVGKGTGMGLSISYTIVTEKHGGRLSCRSTLGKGSEFLIQLPTIADS